MSHFLLTSTASLSSVWKGFKFFTFKELLPSVFSCFKQGWSAFICITENYRFQLFVSCSFSVFCVCLGWHIQSHRMSWRSSRDLLAQDPVSGSVPFSPRGCPRQHELQFLPLPSQKKRRQYQGWSFSPLPFGLHRAWVRWWEASLSLLKQTVYQLPLPLCPLLGGEIRVKLACSQLSAVSSLPPPASLLWELTWLRAKLWAINGSCLAEAQEETRALWRDPHTLFPGFFEPASLERSNPASPEGCAGARAVPEVIPALKKASPLPPAGFEARCLLGVPLSACTRSTSTCVFVLFKLAILTGLVPAQGAGKDRPFRTHSSLLCRLCTNRRAGGR